MTRRLVALLSLLAAGFLAAGCSSHGGGGSPSTTGAVPANTIVIKNFAFEPASLMVAPGATVMVRNEDSATHTVTATGAKTFDTGDIAGGGSRTFVAPTKPGSYPYICTIHNYMQGTLVVR